MDTLPHFCVVADGWGLRGNVAAYLCIRWGFSFAVVFGICCLSMCNVISHTMGLRMAFVWLLAGYGQRYFLLHVYTLCIHLCCLCADVVGVCCISTKK